MRFKQGKRDNSSGFRDEPLEVKLLNVPPVRPWAAAWSPGPDIWQGRILFHPDFMANWLAIALERETKQRETKPLNAPR